MQWLALSDVEQIVRLLSSAADPTVELSIPERKRLLLTGLAALVNADIWYCTTVVYNPQVAGDVGVTSAIEGGWSSEAERVRFVEVLMSPERREVAAKFLGTYNKQHITQSVEKMPALEVRPDVVEMFSGIGVVDFLISQYPLDETGESVFAFYRRLGAPTFTERERTIVHVVVSQVDWLHRHGLQVPAKDSVLKLSTRERQVMFFLLGGDSQKEVAHKLELSEHTVGDYVKRIYKHFDVNSRAELLSHFIAGGQR